MLLTALIFSICYVEVFNCLLLNNKWGGIFSGNEARAIVQEHNRLRMMEQAANMQEMVWNQDLAHMAYEISSRCRADHSQYHERTNKSGFIYSGESIFWSASQWPIVNVIRSFHSEKSSYNFELNQCYLRPGAELHECGHYTQIVWAKTCSVGCAFSHCNHFFNGRGIKGGFMVVCKYGPGLDYNPIPRPFIKGPKCSMCSNIAHCLRTGLCPSKCTPNSECVDKIQNCASKQQAGHCALNSHYMNDVCKSSCKFNGCR